MYPCEKFKVASVQERWAIVKNKKLCYTCLVPKHGNACDSAFKCKKCNQPHNYLLQNNSMDNQRNDRQNPTNHRRERPFERQALNQQQNEQQPERTSHVFHTQGMSENNSSAGSNGTSSLFYTNSG